MLINLEIKNGVMTPKYDIYNDTYTVTIDNDVTELDIYYEVASENIKVSTSGNENITSDKGVGIIVSDGKEEKIIKLNVIKEGSETTSDLKNYFTSLDVRKKEQVPEHIAPLIGVSCFLIIVITFSILFHKKKKLK